MSSASIRRSMADELGAYAAAHGLAIEPGSPPRRRVHPFHGRAPTARATERGRRDPALLRPPRRGAGEGIRPDAARPRHLRHDARHSDPAAHPVRLRDQHRPEAARRRPAGDSVRTTIRAPSSRRSKSATITASSRGRKTDAEAEGLIQSGAVSSFWSSSRATSARGSIAATSRRSWSRPTRPIRPPRATRSARSAQIAEPRAPARAGARAGGGRRRRTSSSRSSSTSATIPTASRNISSCRACSASSCR